jgi:hypothetical protein
MGASAVFMVSWRLGGWRMDGGNGEKEDSPSPPLAIPPPPHFSSQKPQLPPFHIYRFTILITPKLFLAKLFFAILSELKMPADQTRLLFLQLVANEKDYLFGQNDKQINVNIGK